MPGSRQRERFDRLCGRWGILRSWRWLAPSEVKVRPPRRLRRRTEETGRGHAISDRLNQIRGPRVDDHYATGPQSGLANVARRIRHVVLAQRRARYHGPRPGLAARAMRCLGVREATMKGERSHGRRRWVLARIGLVLSLLLVAAWLVSLRWCVGYMTGSRWLFDLSAGTIAIQKAPPREDETPGWLCYRQTRIPWTWTGIWLPEYWRYSLLLLLDRAGTIVLWGVRLPIWIPLIVTAIPTVILWRRGSRPPAGHCQRCGYNLTGNVSGRCSECGERSGEPARCGVAWDESFPARP